MRVVYTGGTICPPMTLKRLLVLANEIGFSDHPSVRFERWGTVGVQTPIRQIAPATANDPVRLVAHSPPNGSPAGVYAPFIERDLSSRAFRELFLNGLRRDPLFHARFLAPDAVHGAHTGRQISAALLADASLLDVDLGSNADFGSAFEIGTVAGRRDTLRVLLISASISVTAGIVAAGELGLAPVTDDPYLAALIALRTDREGGNSSLTSGANLGLEIVRSVISDAMLERIDIAGILEFRKKTGDVYAAWETEIERFGAMLDDGGTTAGLRARAERLVATEIRPKMKTYRAELETARDAVFGDLAKNMAKFGVPALAVAFLHHDPLFAAALTTLGSLTTSFAAAKVDEWKTKRESTRKHGVAYLVKLVDQLDE